MTHPFPAVMRRYVLDYLSCQNLSVCAQIMEPDYVLHMGGTDLGPRDSVYVPAVMRQLEQFPGLGMTVNEIVLGDDRLAMRFTQHGASTRHDGRLASWRGIGLYKWNGTRLTSNYAIEDYASRRRQLADGLPDPVDSPAIAPWDTLVGARNVDAELTVQRWLVEPGADLSEVAFDDEPAGTSSRLIDFETTVVDDCFSAGDAVAFHVTQTGTAAGRAATLYSVGIVHVDAAQRLSGHVVRERVALQRALAEGPLA